MPDNQTGNRASEQSSQHNATNANSPEAKFTGNLHKHYYKDYFRGFRFELVGFTCKLKHHPKECSDQLKNEINTLNKHFTEYLLPEKACNAFYPRLTYESIERTVNYPGLVTGVGIGHEIGIEGEFKLGVHFDYTYGLPVIYGSSVKGVLRAYFRDYAKYLSIIGNAICYQPNSVDGGRLGEGLISLLETAIFDAASAAGEYESASGDVFFDAIPVKANSEGHILAGDFLCPHRDDKYGDLAPLKNPIPISFLKIAPGVTIRFAFQLSDSTIEPGSQIETGLTTRFAFQLSDSKIEALTFSKDEKLELFSAILKEMGVGAKTNVGYGVCEIVEPTSNSATMTGSEENELRRV